MHNFKILLMALLMPGLCGIASAQKINCDSLQQVIKIAAADSTFATMRGEEVKNNHIPSITQYIARFTLWDDPDGLIDPIIEFNHFDHSYRYSVYAVEDGSGKETIAALKNCLHDNWIIKAEAEDPDDTVTYFKNLSNYVVVRVEVVAGDASLEIYNDRKHANPECVTGDCKGDAGAIHYFSEDTYSGTFVNGTLSGIGQVSWYAQGVSYYGSLIDGHIAGFGTFYDKDGKETKKGFFFNGDTVHVDSYKEGCQFGNCDVGFGLKMIFNNVFIGNFKNGLPNGYGETIIGSGETQAVFFGFYKDGHDNGPGLFITHKGMFSFGNFTDGVIHGKYTVYMPDKTVKIADSETRLASYYSSNNILLKTGIGEPGSADFNELKDPAYLEVKAAAQSLDAFYHHRETSYKEIIGEQSPLIKKLAMKGGYKSKILFEGKFNASIDVDHNDYYYISIPLMATSTPMSQWSVIYNKYYRILPRAMGNRWHIIADTGKAEPGKRSTSLQLQNSFDHSQQINLLLDNNGVKLELH